MCDEGSQSTIEDTDLYISILSVFGKNDEKVLALVRNAKAHKSFHFQVKRLLIGYQLHNNNLSVTYILLGHKNVSGGGSYIDD